MVGRRAERTVERRYGRLIFRFSRVTGALVRPVKGSPLRGSFERP